MQPGFTQTSSDCSTGRSATRNVESVRMQSAPPTVGSARMSYSPGGMRNWSLPSSSVIPLAPFPVAMGFWLAVTRTRGPGRPVSAKTVRMATRRVEWRVTFNPPSPPAAVGIRGLTDRDKRTWSLAGRSSRRTGRSRRSPDARHGPEARLFRETFQPETAVRPVFVCRHRFGRMMDGRELPVVLVRFLEPRDRDSRIGPARNVASGTGRPLSSTIRPWIVAAGGNRKSMMIDSPWKRL